MSGLVKKRKPLYFEVSISFGTKSVNTAILMAGANADAANTKIIFFNVIKFLDEKYKIKSKMKNKMLQNAICTKRRRFIKKSNKNKYDKVINKNNKADKNINKYFSSF